MDNVTNFEEFTPRQRPEIKGSEKCIVKNVRFLFNEIEATKAWSDFIDADEILNFYDNRHENVNQEKGDEKGAIFYMSMISRELLELAIERAGDCLEEFWLFCDGRLTYMDIYNASPQLKASIAFPEWRRILDNVSVKEQILSRFAS